MTLWRRVVRFGFRLLYREMAFTYDRVSWLVSGGEWAAWIQGGLTVAQPQVGEVVLEVAHGTGNLQLSLAQQNITAWAVDYSAQMGQIAAEKLRRNGFVPRLARAKGQSLPFGTATFDVLLCSFPSEFLFEPETLREFLRVLKPDGRGVIVLHGALIHGGWWVRLTDKLFYLTGQGRILDDDMPSDETLADRYQRMLKRFREAGMTVAIQAVSTRQGYAVVVRFSHPKIGDARG